MMAVLDINASNYSTIKTGDVNTSDIGSIVTYTYTAYDDAAGNPGASINRTVTVIDYDPINVTSLTVNSSNSVNNSYAKAGDNVAIMLVTDGSDITNITGTILGDASFMISCRYYHVRLQVRMQHHLYGQIQCIMV